MSEWTTIGCRESTKAVLLAVIENIDDFDCPDDYLRTTLDSELAEKHADNADFKKMREVKNDA